MNLPLNLTQIFQVTSRLVQEVKKLPKSESTVAARRFTYSRLGGWRIACSPIMETTVTEARLRRRGYIPFLEYFLKAKYSKVK